MSTFKRIAQVAVDEAIDAVDNVHTFLSINFRSEEDCAVCDQGLSTEEYSWVACTCTEEESQSIPRQMELDLQDCTHLPTWRV